MVIASTRDLSALDRAIVVAIAIVIAKALITWSGVFCRGELVEHSLAQPSVPRNLPMSEWNLLGRSDSDRKLEICDRDQMAIGHKKNSPFGRISCDRSICDRLRSLIASDLRSRSVVH